MTGWTDRFLLWAGPWLASGLIRLFHARLRPEVIGDGPLHEQWRSGGNVILSFWHDQIFLMVKGYFGPAAKVMISASKDGELISRTMGYFNVGSVRGSSTRGGRAALKSMIDLGREAVDLVITPDGPKGPRHEVKEGIVQIARLTGRPVVAMAFACSHGHRFGSWDRFLLPYPWGRAVYSFGEPVFYDHDAGMDAFRCRVQAEMDANNRRATEHLRRYDLSAV